MYSNLLGEFLGTMTLVTFGDGTVACLLLKDSKGNGAGWVHVCFGFAFGIMMGVYTAWAFGAPEGDINPAVTLFKLLAIGTYTFPQAIATMIAQLAGGVVGGVLVYLLYLNYWEATEDPATKLGVFATGSGRRNLPANCLNEVIATILLIMGIQCIVQGAGKVAGGVNFNLLPSMIAFLFFAVAAACGGATGFSLNPARDMGPRIAHAILPIPGKGPSDWQYGLSVATAGPITAALISVFLYKMSF